jgi:hypothetical protein
MVWLQTLPQRLSEAALVQEGQNRGKKDVGTPTGLPKGKSGRCLDMCEKDTREPGMANELIQPEVGPG